MDTEKISLLDEREGRYKESMRTGMKKEQKQKYG